jgi:hypothetical protein
MLADEQAHSLPPAAREPAVAVGHMMALAGQVSDRMVRAATAVEVQVASPAQVVPAEQGVWVPAWVVLIAVFVRPASHGLWLAIELMVPLPVVQVEQPVVPLAD